jgi:DNA-binding NtrC family response regulator
MCLGAESGSCRQQAKVHLKSGKRGEFALLWALEPRPGSGKLMALGLIRLRVLVVDDERAIADTLAMILRTKGHDSRAVYDAEALITDVVMPGVNGIELTTYFAHHFPECKVLLMSGNAATTGLLEDAQRHGHSLAFLSKPLQPDEVLEFLTSCCARYGSAEAGGIA